MKLKTLQDIIFNLFTAFTLLRATLRKFCDDFVMSLDSLLLFYFQIYGSKELMSEFRSKDF